MAESLDIKDRESRLRTANRKLAAYIAGTGIFLAAGLALSLHLKDMEEQPVYPPEKDFKLINDGTVTVFNNVFGLRYDFQKGTVDEPYIEVGPVMRGMSKSDITRYADLSPAEKEKYNDIQQRACALAAGRPGYSDACPR